MMSGMDVRVRVGCRLVLPMDQLPQQVAQELRRAFTYDNPKHAELERMGYPTGAEEKTIATWRHDPVEGGGLGLSLPRGGSKKLREVLKRHELSVAFDDRRTDGAILAHAIPEHRVELRDYQEDAVKTLALRQNCLMRAPTGSGKSTIALALIARLQVPAIVVVWTGVLFDQWIERIEKELGIPRAQVGVIASGKTKLASVTVAMHQTLAAGALTDEVASYFGAIVYDECQKAAAATYFAAIDAFTARYRIGVSANESRKDGKEFLTYDLFGDVAVDIDAQPLIDAGHVLDVEVRVIPTEFDAPWFKVAMSRGGFQARQAFNKLLKQMSEDEVRNKLAADVAAAEALSGEQVIVLSHRREHCSILDRQLELRGVRSGTLLGGQENRDDYRRAAAELRAGTLRAAVGTVQAIGQGVDFPSVAACVVATPLANNEQQWGQVRGRVCRPAPGKGSARCWYLWDRAVYGKRALENLMKWNERVIVRRDDGSWADAAEFLREMKGFGGRGAPPP